MWGGHQGKASLLLSHLVGLFSVMGQGEAVRERGREGGREGKGWCGMRRARRKYNRKSNVTWSIEVGRLFKKRKGSEEGRQGWQGMKCQQQMHGGVGKRK